MEGETSSECSRISSRATFLSPLPPRFPFPLLVLLSCFTFPLLVSIQLISCHQATAGMAPLIIPPPLHYCCLLFLHLNLPSSALTHHHVSFPTDTHLSSILWSLCNLLPVVPPVMPRETCCQGSLLLTALLNQLSNIKRSLHSSCLRWSPDMHTHGHGHIQCGCLNRARAQRSVFVCVSIGSIRVLKDNAGKICGHHHPETKEST